MVGEMKVKHMFEGEIKTLSIAMDSLVLLKDKIWFLRVCQHVSNVHYKLLDVQNTHNKPSMP